MGEGAATSQVRAPKSARPQTLQGEAPLEPHGLPMLAHGAEQLLRWALVGPCWLPHAPQSHPSDLLCGDGPTCQGKSGSHLQSRGRALREQGLHSKTCAWPVPRAEPQSPPWEPTVPAAPRSPRAPVPGISSTLPEARWARSPEAQCSAWRWTWEYLLKLNVCPGVSCLKGHLSWIQVPREESTHCFAFHKHRVLGPILRQ